MIDNHKKSFIINSLRRATYRWPGRWIAEKRSKLSTKGDYFCEQCGLICKKKETQMDHILPVVIVTGWDSWENVLDRMFCSPDGWQRICRPCHKLKTQGENQSRPKRSKKKSKK